MAIGQRERRTLQEALVSSIGAESTDTLMDYLPPVGWADVATKHDLDVLAGKVDALGIKVDALANRVNELALKVEGCATKQDLQTQFYRTITLMVLLLTAFTAVIKLT